MKNKKFIVVCSNMKVPCDEDELLKVYQAISSGEPAMLRQGIFKPSYFVGVIEDEEKMKRLYDDLKYDIRDGKVTEFPKYPDLFPGLREQVRHLAEAKRNPQLNGPVRGITGGHNGAEESWHG